MTFVLGLSGGIGSGKSTVTRLLEKQGATVIDADAIVHELQAAGQPALQEIAHAFGDEMLDARGALDREALGALVFRDPQARDVLGRIMHPRVIAEMVRRTEQAKAAGVPLVVLDVPLLFEGAKEGRGVSAVVDFDATVVVWAPESEQLERQMARDGRDRDAALARIRAQMPLTEKRALADEVIDNSGTLEETEAQVRALVERVTRKAAAC